MKRITISPKEDLIFDLKVREMCKSCKRYGRKATCPPHVESFKYYEKLLPQYSYGIIFCEKFSTVGSWIELGKESSLKIYKKVLLERSKLLNNGHYFFIGFGAGSCKLCDECSFPCKSPQKSLIPFEATGVDIVKTLEKFNIRLEFPVKKYFYRIGALFYD